LVVMLDSNIPVSEDSAQRTSDGSGHEEVADPQGVFTLGVEEGEVDGLWSVVSITTSYPSLINNKIATKHTAN
jgi:hypothetical protein